MSLHVLRICETCGVEFLALARRVRAGRGRNCSRSCQSRGIMRRRHAAQPMTGAKNPNWRGGRSQHPYPNYVRPFKAANPEKVRAHRIVFEAVRVGVLVRPSSCSECNGLCRPQAHHDDYAHPLVVRWLCKPCHRKADQARQQKEAA